MPCRSSRRRALCEQRAEEFKPKIDLSHISKPGDVLKAITQRAAQTGSASAFRYALAFTLPHPVRRLPLRPSAVPPKAVPPAPPSAAASTPGDCRSRPSLQPRFITPQSVPRPPAPVITRPKPPAPPERGAG